MTRSLSPTRLLSIAIAAAAFACSLQTSGIGAQPDGGAVAPTATDGAPATADDGAERDDAAPVDGQGSIQDATVLDGPVSDGGDLDAIVLDPDAADAPRGGDSCDLDGDGHRARGPTCGGDDCCDYDGRAYPGQGTFFESPDACGSFDYDCDGALTAKYAKAACKLGFFSCSGDGFDKPVQCGVKGDFVTCSWAGFSCSTALDPRIQPCR